MVLVSIEGTLSWYGWVPKGRAERGRYPTSTHVYVFQPAINVRSLASILLG